ncbi:NADH:flavin oxidoreductase [Alisedimentitalea sp. MJ-SS2]|uniref:NADH:flavin oxidoreductase n=1 Tax=Aliisedimentitalea sp. MJ-SS2 TaxID=3049795 RepID=UPI00290D713A|nr:NADH:flavin oxidoreductase [Alisedimentitalea sp. MJ-SS2]MDU8927637.1 NADH:flavin oxidoreductase [Alisedimentitalea sp. MJ-SS2]
MDPLLEPFQLRHLTLRNRIMSTAHAPSFQEGGHPRERYRLYHEEKAKGGIGLSIIGGSTNIAPDSPSVFGQLYAGDDSIIPWFKELTDGVRSHGAAVICQITHMGRRTAWDNGHWLPVAGPSGTRERAHRSFPKAMEQEDITRVIGDFASAAQRCQLGGFDGIELLSHSHLLGQFLSPLVNKRDDDYGGSLDNRMRLSLQVVEAVRDTVGPDIVLGMRITGDELLDGGLSGEECVEIARKLAETGAVDFLNVLAGAPYDDLGLAGWVAPMGMPSAPHLGIAGQIRAAVDIPVFHAGGIADIATARHAVAAGHVDLVGMTRAHIADPYLVNKLRQGDEERIRPCVGLGYCVDRVNQGKPAVCGHNAATGREQVMPHVLERAHNRRKVVIAGGGPGGMEAARVCAERGHEVVLFEAGDRLGGQINLAAKGMTRRQIWGVADWLMTEVARLGVDVRLNTYVEAADVMAEAPDLVVVATGGWPETPDVPGGDIAISGWDVLGGEARLSGEVLLFDEVGDQPATVCADVLARAGAMVTMVTPDRMVAHDLGPTNAAVVLRDLVRQGVVFECFLDLVGIAAEGNRKRVVLRHVLTGETSERLCDHVVVENGSVPVEALYHDLKPQSRNMGQLDQVALIAGTDPFVVNNPLGQYDLARIGDAVAARNIHAAILDALRVCKNF